MIFKIGLLSAALVACATPTVLAQSEQGTPQERAACAPDVRKFCKSANDDTMRVLACLQANRGKITSACNKVLVSHGQ
jgi:Cysteine rich repeat